MKNMQEGGNICMKNMHRKVYSKNVEKCILKALKNVY